MKKSLLEVTAFNPANGKSKQLAEDELEELLKLLARYEEAAGGGTGAGAMESLNHCYRELRAIGLDPRWFDRPPAGGQRLFLARVSGQEAPGSCLKDLLAIARDAGLIGLRAAYPREKLVFIVDDDDTFREMIGFSLRKEGFQVDLFSNGVEVIEGLQKILPERAPDLILLDLMMPQQGGFDVMRSLQGEVTSKIPIIILTGRNVDPQMCQMLRQESNVVEFMSKPVRPKALGTAIHTLLKTKPLDIVPEK